MAIPNLNPASTSNANILPVTGAAANVATTLPFGIYAGSTAFLSGASDQVAYTYKKLGGDVLDIELAEGNVYAAYEEAVLEYGYLVNLFQTKNSLSSYLGATTGSFDQDGQISTGSLSGSNIALRYPRFDYGYIRRISEGLVTEAGFGGTTPIYSASVPSWKFYGYYGGFSVVGNMNTYGQYADDSTFEIVPTWQNKLQAMAYEDALYTRVSHYSYEIHDNKLRLFPTPDQTSPGNFWVQFTINNQHEPWDNQPGVDNGAEGVNNINTIPFENIPYENINAIGKQWIRRFALALTKEMLGQIRGKFSSVPIPGESVTLNYAELLSQARTEMDQLREELKTILEATTYDKLAEIDSSMQDSTKKVLENIPAGIFVG